MKEADENVGDVGSAAQYQPSQSILTAAKVFLHYLNLRWWKVPRLCLLLDIRILSEIFSHVCSLRSRPLNFSWKACLLSPLGTTSSFNPRQRYVVFVSLFPNFRVTLIDIRVWRQGPMLLAPTIAARKAHELARSATSQRQSTFGRGNQELVIVNGISLLLCSFFSFSPFRPFFWTFG